MNVIIIMWHLFEGSVYFTVPVFISLIYLRAVFIYYACVYFTHLFEGSVYFTVPVFISLIYLRAVFISLCLCLFHSFI